MPKNWIQGAIKHPGSLHRAMNVKQGQKIPLAKLHKAAGGKGITAKRAQFAQELASFKKC